jgi:hypothetical protein
VVSFDCNLGGNRSSLKVRVLVGSNQGEEPATSWHHLGAMRKNLSSVSSSPAA